MVQRSRRRHRSETPRSPPQCANSDQLALRLARTRHGGARSALVCAPRLALRGLAVLAHSAPRTPRAAREEKEESNAPTLSSSQPPPPVGCAPLALKARRLPAGTKRRSRAHGYVPPRRVPAVHMWQLIRNKNFHRKNTRKV